MHTLKDIEKLRYHRHLILDEIGTQGQERIKNSKVLVIGAGGLGCPVIQYLTAIGIGQLCIMDNDTIDISNLQRQVFYGINDIGKHKALVAAKLMSVMNPLVELQRLVVRIDYSNALEVIEPFDLVLDCTDNLAARYVLSDACVMLDKPLVHAAVFKTAGQLSVFNYKYGPSYRCLFPKPSSEDLKAGPSLGIYSILPGIFGLMQANEAIKIVLDKPGVLSGTLLMYDTMGQDFHSLKITRDPNNFDKTKLKNYFHKKQN